MAPWLLLPFHPWLCQQLPRQTLCPQAGAADCGQSVALWGSACVFLSSRGDSDHEFCPGGLVFGRSWASSSREHILAEVLRIPECCSLSSWADGVCLCLGNELCKLPLLILLMKSFFVLLTKSCSPPLLQSVCPLLPLS